MKINTKVIFEWNNKSKQYEEVYCESYEYDGEVAQCFEPIGDLSNMFANMYGNNNNTPDYQYGNKNIAWGKMPKYHPDLLHQLESSSLLGSAGHPYTQGTYSNASYKFSDKLDFSSWGGLPSTGPQAPAGSTSGGGFGKVMSRKEFGKQYKAKKAGQSAAKKGGEGFFGSAAAQGGMMAGGALVGGITGYMQAKSQKKGLSAAIGELDPIKTQAFGAYEKMGDIAESYRPGGTYSRYMGGRILSQAEESVGQETSRMIASGITSPSMMRQMGIQSRRQAQTSLPGMEMQVSQMALPYEQLASGYFSEYKGLGEQMAGLKGARAAIDPWSSALSGAMSGAMGAATMVGSLASDRRMKKDIKYLHTSNEGHKVYSFKYKDGDTKYSGVMAQDVLKINPNAVTLKNGMLAVYYNMIDVDMQQLDII